MARAGRLAGAILAETRGDHYLVGNTKVPCDFAAAGFETPPAIDARARPFIRLSPCGEIDPEGRSKSGPLHDRLTSPVLTLNVEGEALPRLLADVFLIERTGSISERLWRLVLGQGDDEDDCPASEIVPARWLGEVPPQIWHIVRDTVLRCS